MAASTDLERAFLALSGKKASYDQLFRYYDGDQPLVYSSSKLRELFAGIDARFSENWCAVVVDAVLDRLELKGFSCEDNTAAEELLKRLWEDDGLDLDADEAHEASLVSGEGFIIAWKSAEGELEVYQNDPRLVHVFYEQANPKAKAFAAKWWVADDGEGDRLHLTLYYPDRFEHYVSLGKPEGVTDARSLVPAEPPTEANETGEIPVFHFRSSRRRILGELANVRDLQDAVNKLFCDLMVSAEFAAFKQRYIISNADTTTMKNGPDQIWNIPAGDGEGQGASAGQFEATDLQNFLGAMDNLASKIAVITRTPKHFLLLQGGDPSGEALLAMEAPLNKKVAAYQKRLSPVWRELAAYVCKLSGIDLAAADIKPNWAEARTVQPVTEAVTIVQETNAGIPLVTSLRRHGWDEEELQQLEDDKKAEGNAGTQGANLLEMMRQRNSGATGANLPATGAGGIASVEERMNRLVP